MPEYRNPQHEMQGVSFEQLCDEICTTLTAGSLWHERAAIYMYDYGLRGFGQLNCHNSIHDHCKKLCLEKLLVDRIDHIPTLDMNIIAKAADYSMSGAAQLKDYLKSYIHREMDFTKVLNEAVRMSTTIDMEIYSELCCILSGVQEEIFRVKQIYERLELGGWSGHDIMVVSRLLHKHHESHDNMDYTLS